MSLRNGVFPGDEQFVARHLDEHTVDERVLEIPTAQTRRTRKPITDRSATDTFSHTPANN